MRAFGSCVRPCILGAGLLALAQGCHRDAAPRAKGDDALVVASVGDSRITVGDMKARIQSRPPYARARYSTPEKVKELLDESVKFEVLAKQAERRGYEKDPAVVRAMKEQMVATLMERDFDAKHQPGDVPKADVEKYYGDHASEFRRADEVRVSEVFTHERAAAERVLAEVKAHPPTAGADVKGFRDLVAMYSEDAASKDRGGDLGSFDRESRAQPKPLVDAAFALEKVGDVSAPIAVDGGWAVLLLTQKRPGFSRPFAEVANDIRQRLFRDGRQKALEAFMKDLTTKANVQYQEENLGKVVAIGARPEESARVATQR